MAWPCQRLDTRPSRQRVLEREGHDGCERARVHAAQGDGRQCVVRWDTGSENEYAIGYGGLYDLEAA